MAEKLEIALDTSGINRAVADLGQAANAIGLLGMGGTAAGGISAGVAGIALAAVVQGITQTLKRFEQSVKAAADTIQSLMGFSTTQFGLGSSTSQTHMLRMLGASLGISDVSGSAARLHRATLSGLGAMEASRLGIPIRPHEIGTGTNRGEMLIQALEGLRTTFREQGFGATVAMARNLDIEEWLNVVLLLDRQFARLKQDAVSSSGAFSSQRGAAAVQLNHEMSRLTTTFTTARNALVMLFLPGLNYLIEIVTSAAGHFARINPFGAGVKGFFDRLMGGGSGATGNAQTQALRDNTLELRRLNGIYGGAGRTRSAIPGAFGPGNGFMLQNALRAQTVRLGAYSVAL